MDDETGDADVCTMIYTVALETAGDKCETDAGKRHAVAKMLNVADEIPSTDFDELLDGGIDEEILSSPSKTNLYVVGLMFEEGLVEEHDGDTFRAMNEAFDRVYDAEPLFEQPDDPGDLPDDAEDAESESEDAESDEPAEGLDDVIEDLDEPADEEAAEDADEEPVEA